MAAWEELHRLLLRAQALAREIEAGQAVAADGPDFGGKGDDAWPCYPRSYLALRLPAELARAGRFGRFLALGVLAFDEPVFAGDAIRGLEESLREALDPFDVPVRCGVDRMVLILPEAGRGEARHKAERLAAALVMKGVASRPPRIGIAVHPEQGHSAEELLGAAEREVERERRTELPGIAAFWGGYESPPLLGSDAVSRNGHPPRSDAPEAGSEEPVAVGFAADRRLPLSFWRGETLHVIHAILADETSPSGSRRLSVLTDGGGFLLFERDGRWYAEALPPSNGAAPFRHSPSRAVKELEHPPRRFPRTGD